MEEKEWDLLGQVVLVFAAAKQAGWPGVQEIDRGGAWGHNQERGRTGQDWDFDYSKCWWWEWDYILNEYLMIISYVT